MRLTNNTGLPGPIVKAVTHDPYTRGRSHISATTLKDSPRIRLLRERHQEEIVEDVSDRLWALYGQVGHAILERAAQRRGADGFLRRLYSGLQRGVINSAEEALGVLEGYLNQEGDGDDIVERRYYAEYEGPLGPWIVSGQVDLLRESSSSWVITDYKFTSVWAVIPRARGGRLREWEEQLNIYAALCRRQDPPLHPVGLEVVAILRDWSQGDLRRIQGYPPIRVQRVTLPLWPAAEAESYVLERVRVHQQAESMSDVELPHCTPSERWETDPRWEVWKKEGGSRVLKTCESEAEALAWIEEKYRKPELYMAAFRPGKPKRCGEWCNVESWCSQRAEEKKFLVF